MAAKSSRPGKLVELGTWLRDKRLAQRLASGRHPTQAQIAARAGVPRETICSVERGRMPQAHTLANIALALGVDLADLPTVIASGLWRNPAGVQLRALREARGLTLEQCAAAAGVSASTLSRFEAGIGHSPALAKGGLKRPYARMCNKAYARALGFESTKELGRHLTTRKARARIVSNVAERNDVV